MTLVNDINPKQYYITTSNFKKLVFASQITTDNMTAIFHEVYEKLDLSPYISLKEIKNLRKRVLFLQKSDDFLVDLEKKNRAVMEEHNKLNMHSRFVFVSQGPKYHTDGSCKTLVSDFSNFQIPPEIEERGPHEIDKFREFAYAKRKLLGEGREDVFLMLLKTTFNLKSDIQKVLFVNSGKSEVSVRGESLSLHEITSQIDTVTGEIEAIKRTEEGGKAVKAVMYASTKLLDTKPNLTDIERHLLENKRALLNLVTQYNIIKHKGTDVTFSQNLLLLYGFKPCGVCCAENFAIPF